MNLVVIPLALPQKLGLVLCMTCHVCDEAYDGRVISDLLWITIR